MSQPQVLYKGPRIERAERIEKLLVILGWLCLACGIASVFGIVLLSNHWKVFAAAFLSSAVIGGLFLGLGSIIGVMLDRA